uniref:Peroxisomal membrane protein MPV17 n=1 Tax=Alexandrium andersonii TaxID=327968 RepID=A0A7S2CDS8_9DINO
MAFLGKMAPGILARRPVLFNVIAAGALTGVADATAQCLERRGGDRADGKLERVGGKAPMEPGQRLTSMVCFGFAMGLIYPPWYRQLDRWFSSLAPKLLFHQALASPVHNGAFLCYVEAVQGPVGTTWSRMCRRLDADWLHIIMRSFPFWISVNVINLQLVTVAWRGVTMNFVNCLWTMYLSWRAHREFEAEKA